MGWWCIIIGIMSVIRHAHNIEANEQGLITKPKAVAVVLSQDLTLDCDVRYGASITTSSPPPSSSSSASSQIHYQWLFNGSDIETALPKGLLFQNHSLFVPRVSEADLGSYQCIAWPTNSSGNMYRSDPIHVIETYIDDFYINPESVQLFENNNTILQCVTGYTAPPADVYWQKDGAPFLQGTQEIARFGTAREGIGVQQSMTLQFVAELRYNGTYRCVARNPLNNVTKMSSEAFVKIQAPMRSPYIVEALPSDLLLTEGVPFVLSCPVAGWPLPRISWYQAGTPVSDTDRKHALRNGSLSFDPVLRQDSDRYHCIGANVLGSVPSTSVNVSVAYLDVAFRLQPVDTEVVAGQATKLQCQPPASYPNVTVMWYKDVTPVRTRTGPYAMSVDQYYNLVFDSVQIDDAGVYYCVAHNEFTLPKSRTSDGAKLIVEGSPQLYQPPTDVTVVRGDLLTLKCKVKGYPQPAVAWYKDSDLILPDTRIIIRDMGQELLISDVNILDEGYYRCLASNMYGKTTSQLAAVDVIVPPEVTNKMIDLSAVEGDDVVFTCAFYGDPVPAVTWFKDGKELTLKPASRLFLTKEGLNVNKVTAQDEGRYTCHAENMAGAKEQHAFLDVQERPVFISYPQSTVVNVSQSVIFYCEATGDPQPTVSWRINGTNQLPPGVEVSDDISTLIIESAAVYHSGNYTCVATNSLAKINKTALLVVQERPRIHDIVGNKTVNQGSIIDLQCIVEANPKASIEWYHIGTEIDAVHDRRVVISDSGTRLRIQYVSSGDGGEYSCMAHNNAGSSTKTIQIYVRETPLPPFLDKAQALSRSSINLTWIPVSQEFHTNVLYYVVQYKKLKAITFTTFRDDISNQSTSVEVGHLDSGTDYLFRVASRNVIGIGDYSRVIGARTLESAPGTVRNLKLVSQTDAKLVLSWEVPLKTNGEIYRYELQYRKQRSAQGYVSEMITVPQLPIQTYTLFDLEAYTTYTVRVRAANRNYKTLLWGEFTNITVTTLMKAPGSPPVNVLITVLTSSSIKVTWQPVPVQLQYGALLGYIVYYRLADTELPFMEQRLNATLMETLLMGLLPWRYYAIAVAAYNAAGVGVKSEVRRVRTLAEAPAGTPRDVRINAVGSKSVKVSWKELAVDDRRSDISGYLVWYKNTTTNQSYSVYIPDPTVLTTTLRNLVPWTVYLIQVQAFTTQVEHGFGPLSLEQRVQTEQDVPGKVSAVVVTIGSTEVMLSWQPPSQPNGVITGYQIEVYKEIANTGTSLIRVRRSVIHYDNSLDADKIQRFGLSAQDMSVIIDQLTPDKQYFVTLSAKTIKGQGEAYNMTVMTKPVQGVASVTVNGLLVTTEADVMMTSEALTKTDVSVDSIYTTTDVVVYKDNASQNQFIGIVAGSVIGGLFVLLLLILVVILCQRKVYQTKPSYIYSDSYDTSTSETESDNQHHRRHHHQLHHSRVVTECQDSAAPYTTSNTGYAQSSSSPSDLPQRPLVNYPTTTNLNHQPSVMPGVRRNTRPDRNMRPDRNVIPDRNMRPDRNIRPDRNRSEVFSISQPPLYAPFSTESEPTPSEGYNNAGYIDEALKRTANNVNGVPYNRYRAADMGLQPEARIKTRHSQHMSKRAAAVIAAQKTRDTSVFQDIPDTDRLLNQSVVVYNERTAL